VLAVFAEDEIIDVDVLNAVWMKKMKNRSLSKWDCKVLLEAIINRSLVIKRKQSGAGNVIILHDLLREYLMTVLLEDDLRALHKLVLEVCWEESNFSSDLPDLPYMGFLPVSFWNYFNSNLSRHIFCAKGMKNYPIMPWWFDYLHEQYCELQLAATLGFESHVKLLVQAGQVVETSDKLTALHYASVFGHETIVMFLLEHKVNVRQKVRLPLQALMMRNVALALSVAIAGRGLVDRVHLKAMQAKWQQELQEGAPSALEKYPRKVVSKLVEILTMTTQIDISHVDMEDLNARINRIDERNLLDALAFAVLKYALVLTSHVF